MLWKWSGQLLGPLPVAYAKTRRSERKPGRCSGSTASKHTDVRGLTTCLTRTLRRVWSQIPEPGAERKHGLAGCRLQVLDEELGSELAVPQATPW